MKRWQVVLLVLMAVLALSGVGLARYLMPYKLEDEIKLARAQGVATTVAECLPRVPPSQDAWPDYELANKLDDDFWTPDLEHARTALTSKTGPTPAELAKLRRVFERHSTYISTVHSAASKPACSFGSAKDEAVAATFPRFEDLRVAAKTLRDEAELLAWEDKPMEAVKTLDLLRNVAEHAHSHPTILGALVGCAIDSMLDRSRRHLLRKYGANSEMDRIVRDSLSNDLEPADIRKALSGEAASLLASATIGGLENNKVPIYRRVYYKGVFAAALHWTTEEIIAGRAPADQQRRKIQTVTAAFDLTIGRNRMLREAGGWFPRAEDAMDRLDEEVSKRRTTYAAACVLEYKARTGTYPATLSQAEKTVPLDPFSGAPLDYRRTAKGFEVVSAEASRRWAARVSKEHRNDLVFAYPK